MATSMGMVAEPSTPTYQQIDLDREGALIYKMCLFINKLGSSRFYHNFLYEFLNSPIYANIQKILGSETQMKMVIYGIGSIESDGLNGKNCPKWQLSLALLMKNDFKWIGDVEVYDPILSPTEIRILKSLGCSVLDTNERARRHVLKPTMFFMPFCHIKLFNNLIEANWELNPLSNTIIFGNSLDLHIKDVQYAHELGKRIRDSSDNLNRNDPRRERERNLDIWRNIGHILAAQTFTNEFKMRTISYDDARLLRLEKCEYSFTNLSWHFFSPYTETFMQLMRENTGKKHGVVLPKKKKHLATS